MSATHNDILQRVLKSVTKNGSPSALIIIIYALNKYYTPIMSAILFNSRRVFVVGSCPRCGGSLHLCRGIVCLPSRVISSS